MRGGKPLITPNYKGAVPLYNPPKNIKEKDKKLKKTKTTEGEKTFLSTCGTKDESKIDERN